MKNAWVIYCLFFMISASAQKIELISYRSISSAGYHTPDSIEIKTNFKTKKTKITIFQIKNKDSVFIVKGHLNSRQLLIDSLFIYDDEKNILLSGYFKDTVGGTYEKQFLMYNFYQLGGVKEGKFITYTYSGTEKFIETVKEYKNGLLHGECIVYYDKSTQIHTIHHFQKGQYHGEFINYNRDGTYNLKGEFKNGKDHGLRVSYYENNQPKENLTYEDGVLNGQFKTWHPNGKLYRIGWHENGQYNGYYHSWYSNGNKCDSLFYENGNLHGLNKTWYRNGQLKTIGTYEKGKLVSEYKYWTENGQLVQYDEYSPDGKRNGIWKRWYENGKIQSESRFKNDELNGLQKTWHENGKLKSLAEFKDGKMIRRKNYDEKGNEEKDQVEEEIYEWMEQQYPPVEDINEMDRADEYVNFWKEPSVALNTKLSKDQLNILKKSIGCKFIVEINSGLTYTVKIHPDFIKNKKAKKAVPVLQNSLQVSPLNINGKRWNTSIEFELQ